MRKHRFFPTLLLLASAPLVACTDDAVGAAPTGDGSGGIDPTLDTGGDDVVDDAGLDSTGADSSSGGEDGDGSCTDNVHNGDETDVDCGGPDCPQCEPPQMCEGDSDCTTEICDNGECQAPSCYDGVRNGNESGVDCGGGCPNVCLPGPGPCDDDPDCEDGEFCMEGECMPSDCSNGIQDSSETDIDCGGIDCPDCEAGSACVLEEDCRSGVCSEGSCADPTCEDQIQNGDETDTDCGGPDCGPCPNGADCTVAGDCATGSCDDGTCVAASCMDMIENGLETDVDCGGPVCLPCESAAECEEADDCDSGVCETNMCADPACDDMVVNGDETDVDCGNSCGVGTCAVGQQCDDGTDCAEQVCEFNVCSAPDCFDGVLNGVESGVDCGDNAGPGCPLCDGGEGCVGDDDCDSGVCDEGAGTCDDPSCGDGVLNGDETDVDCGNACGATCEVGEVCDDPLDCTTSSCQTGTCAAATCDDGILNGDEGGLDCSGSCAQPCTTEDETTVNTTTADFQTSPTLAIAPDGSFWVVAWTSTPVAAAAQDGSGAGIFAQMFDDAGPVGAEFQVNSTSAGNQRFADVAAYNDGFVILWQSDGDQDGDATGIFGQLYDDTGTEVGTEFGVNATTANAQRRPSVAMDSAGNFVACWDGVTVDYDVWCRRFSAAGVAQTGDMQINTGNTGDEQLPVVARDDIGNYTVAWQSSGGGDGSGIGVFMRRFNSSDVEVTAETQVNSTTAGNQSEPAVAVDPDGDFVVVWTAQSLDGSSTGIGAQRYDENAVTQGGEITVNTTTAGAQQRPDVAFASDGDYWIAWQTPDDGDTTGIFGRRFSADGSTVGVEFVVNPATAEREEDPVIGIRLNSELVAAWTYGDQALTTANIQLVRYDGEL